VQVVLIGCRHVTDFGISRLMGCATVQLVRVAACGLKLEGRWVPGGHGAGLFERVLHHIVEHTALCSASCTALCVAWRSVQYMVIQ
jgi:hypothetical protein